MQFPFYSRKFFIIHFTVTFEIFYWEKNQFTLKKRPAFKFFCGKSKISFEFHLTYLGSSFKVKDHPKCVK